MHQPPSFALPRPLFLRDPPYQPSQCTPPPSFQPFSNSFLQTHDSNRSSQQDPVSVQQRRLFGQSVPSGNCAEESAWVDRIEESKKEEERDTLKPGLSQSQFIDNLSFNLQDLLKKIAGVTEGYECKETAKKEKAVFDHQSSKSSGETDTARSMDASKDSQQLHQLQTSQTLPRQVQFPLENEDTKDPKKVSTSLKSIETTEKSRYRMHSLFEKQFVREVAASQIIDIDQQTGRAGCSSMVVSMLKDSQLRIEDFELGKCVGEGKFGDVYVCRHKKTNCIYALKKIMKSTVLEYGMVEQLILELKINYYVSHPNIVKLYTHFSDEYHVFLLMEYATGGMLMDYLRKPQPFVATAISQVVNGVQHLHDMHVAHRDIKPENIVVLFDNVVKLCDFGWSSIFNSNIMKKTFCGTLEYVSPEMKDVGEYSNLADLWSIGILAYELITGSAPYKDKIQNWKRKGSKRQVAWDWNILYPPSISSLAQNFMRQLLKKNPYERASLRSCKGHPFLRSGRLRVITQAERQFQRLLM